MLRLGASGREYEERIGGKGLNRGRMRPRFRSGVGQPETEMLKNSPDLGDWRLPNIKKLHSLIDHQNHLPALPTGHPFTNVEHWYWVSTTIVTLTSSGMTVGIDGGVVFYDDKGSEYWACCVRDGQ